LIGCEPVLHDLLADRLGEVFQIVGTASNADDALLVARSTAADVVLFDTDLWKSNPAELVAKLSLVSAAPLVALSARAAAGGAASAALLTAGAVAVVAKGSGQLPLDLVDGVGERLISTLKRVASS
jgi:chemotaxis response regulator CheB